jgi:hypothetical protein
MKANNFNKILRITDITLLFITGLNALAAGYSFIVEPSGEGLGLNIDYLKFSSFENFSIPGLILFITLGIGSIAIGIIALLKKYNYSLLILFQGCIITGWILIQVLILIMFHALHLIIFTIGIILIISGFLLPNRKNV